MMIINEEAVKLRGKYELLKDELQNLSSQIVTEAKEITNWVGNFDYCDRAMCENILTSTKKDVSNIEIIINRIKRLKICHDQAIEIIDRINEVRPLINK